VNEYAPELDTTQCLSCPTNSVTPSRSDELTDCQCVPGYTGNNGGPCAACAQGSFKPTTGSNGCTNCAANFYGTTEAAVDEASCAACPEHSLSVAGSHNVTLCYCVSGYRQAGDYASCIKCSSGYYDSATERFECSKCAGGL
jgi:hypothetical protein